MSPPFVFPFIFALPAENQLALAQGGCITPLLAAMTNFVEDSELQRNALGAMYILADNGTLDCLTPAAAVCAQHVECPVMCAAVCLMCAVCAVCEVGAACAVGAVGAVETVCVRVLCVLCVPCVLLCAVY
jgi:hypothetical protein